MDKYVPKGDTTAEKRRDELGKKLGMVFQKALQQNQAGYRFSASGGYGVGNDAQIREDYYEYLALGGDPSQFAVNGAKLFEGNYWNAISKGGTTEQVKNRWKNTYHSNKADYSAKRSMLEQMYAEVYADR